MMLKICNAVFKQSLCKFVILFLVCKSAANENNLSTETNAAQTARIIQSTQDASLNISTLKLIKMTQPRLQNILMNRKPPSINLVSIISQVLRESLRLTSFEWASTRYR